MEKGGQEPRDGGGGVPLEARQSTDRFSLSTSNWNFGPAIGATLAVHRTGRYYQPVYCHLFCFLGARVGALGVLHVLARPLSLFYLSHQICENLLRK